MITGGSEGVIGSGLPVRRVGVEGDPPFGPDEWPARIPAVARLLAEGLTLGPATVLVGENGTGKSTIVEAIAMAYGLNPEGGSRHTRHTTRRSESALASALTLSRGIDARGWGYFLRAETMHGLYSYLEGIGDNGRLHQMSHGESFLDILGTRFTKPGFYVLDEPESALSFTGCLALVGVLQELIRRGRSQVLVATHSPVVAALPGARILELGDDGWQERAWDDLALVDHYREFTRDPQQYLRHLRNLE